MTMLYLIFASAWCKRPQRPNPDLTDDQYSIMRAIDFIGHRSFLLCDNPFHTLFLFLGFVILTAIRNLPISMTALSTLLFLASLFYRRLITHASYSLIISIVLLASDAAMMVLYLALLAIGQSIVPSLSFWPPSVDPPLHTPEFWLLRETGYIRILESYFLKKMLGLFLYGGLAITSILLILVCLCMLSRIRSVTTKIFYLRESYRFYAILGFVRCVVLSHIWPFSMALGKLWISDLGMLVVFLADASLYILMCCAIHLIFVAFTDAKSVSVEKETEDPKEKK